MGRTIRSLVLAATAVLLASLAPTGASSAPVPSAPEPSDALATDDPVGTMVPAEIVIETFDHEHGADAGTRAAVDDLRRDQALHRALLDRWVPEHRALAVGDDIAVRYVTSTPAAVRTVVAAALAEWNGVLTTRAAGPVVIDFHWDDLAARGMGNVLGFAGPSGYVRRGDGLYYPVALANTLDRRDYTTGAEIEITLSSSPSWWFDVATPPPSNCGCVDLYGTVVHEIAHGLGFLGSAEIRDGRPALHPQPEPYDALVTYRNRSIIDLSRTDPGTTSAALTSGDLEIDIGGGRTYDLFAPTFFRVGSSYSHFDENTYPAGTAGSLMTPSVSDGQGERAVDAPTVGVLAGMGWPLDIGPVSATIAGTSLAPGRIDVSWTVDLSQQRAPADLWRVRAFRSNVLDAETVVGGASSAARLDGLVDGATYRIEVVALRGAATGAAATRTLDLRPPPSIPSLVDVTGSGLARTVRWNLASDGGSPVQRYDVQRSTSGGEWRAAGTATTTSIATGTLTAAPHQFRIRAVNANGASDWGYSLPIGFTDSVVRPFPLDGEVARLYQAVFDRLPDPGGMAHWLGQRSNGTSLLGVAELFVGSAEFRTRYAGLDDRRFVEALYRNVLGRDGEADGVTFWTSLLAAGATRAQVVVEFSQSDELIARSGTRGRQSATAGAIERLYLAYFLRPPDAAGAAFWQRQLTSGQSLGEISAGFAQSPEFVERYGVLDDAEFVTLVYDNVLSRRPDDAGRSFWTTRLAQGVRRSDMMTSFAESAEFVVRTGTVR